MHARSRFESQSLKSSTPPPTAPQNTMDTRGRGGKVALIVTVRPTPPDRLPHSLWFAKKALSIKITVCWLIEKGLELHVECS